ncbi:MAG: hypothetical protein ACREGA_04160 [Candidatus Saccharimonadales bacterium]
MPYLLSAGTALGNAVLSDQQATTSTAEAALGKEEAGVMSSSEENAFMNQVYTKANAAINDLYSLNAQAAKQHGCQTNAGKPILYTLNPVN